MKNKEFLAAHIDPELKAWLHQKAKREERTLQAVIERLLRTARHEEQKKMKKEQLTSMESL